MAGDEGLQKGWNQVKEGSESQVVGALHPNNPLNPGQTGIPSHNQCCTFPQSLLQNVFGVRPKDTSYVRKT